FFSSRRRHTRFDCDWSSDVCSSDLASWSAFLAQLDAKAEEAGRQFAKVNPAYTSQTCSQCGHRQKMPLSERVFNCPCCHVHLDRDLNAASNIRALGLQGLGLSLEAPGFSRGE